MSTLMKTMLTSIVIILLGGVTAFVALYVADEKQADGNEEPTVDDMVRFSYETPEITTDLADGHFVRIQFQVVTNGTDAQEEIAKRDFQLKNILIKELATMNADVFTTGLDELEVVLVDRLNELLTTGDVTDVYTISKILQ